MSYVGHMEHNGTYTYTVRQWIDYLHEQRFGTNGAWFDRGQCRVAFDDTDVVVYHFARKSLGGVGPLVWQARFSNLTPAPVIQTAIQTAGLASEDAPSAKVTIPE